MCGIVFYDVTGSTTDAIETLRKRADTISHRGPDGSATSVVKFGDRSHLMAFHRLAIINPEGMDGMQPLHHDDATLICNGEVYNYKDIACAHNVDPATLGNDVHVLLHALVSAKTHDDVRTVLASVDGEFALIINDPRNGRVVAARDPWGVRPLFCARNIDGRVVAFASEAKALIGCPGVERVEVFPPRHVMISRGDGDYELTAYPPTPIPLPVCTSQDYVPCVETVRRLVETAIRKRIAHSDRPVGILCSGGLDSAIVTALVASDVALRQRIRVFTIKYDSGQSEDAFYAEYLCSQAGLTLEVVKFGAKDVIAAIEPVIRACESCDPNTIRAAIPMYLLARHISLKTDVKVVLSGEGADELFCGYSYLRKVPEEGAHAALNTESARLLQQLHMFDLLRADRCFGAFGLEVRVPYLDLALVDHVMGLPGSIKAITKRSNFEEKRLLRDAFRDLDTPIATLLNGSRIIDRPKEKLSDGCGFSYIPHLLAHLGEGSGRLDDREAKERSHYRTIFDSLYGADHGSLVIPRVMPAWAGSKESVGALMDVA